MLGLLLSETANLILLGFFDNLQISTNLGSLNWRELSPQVTEGVPARRRQRAQYIIAMHHLTIVQITTIAIPATARRVVAPYNTMSELCTKSKAPSPRELSPQVTEGVPARRRQRAQYIIAMQISRHHPSASLPPSSERRACRCPKFAQSQRLPP